MKILRAGLCALLAFSVLAYGSVEVWSQSIVEIGAGLLLLLWLALVVWKPDTEIRWNPLNWPILGFCGVGAMQLAIGATAYPFLTRSELLLAITCWVIFFLATQAFRTRSDLQVLAWFLMIFCFLVSLEAIAQYFSAGDDLYWLRPVGGGVKPFGPFVNRNHFAGFVELTLPTGLALLMLRGVRRDLAPLATLLVLVPLSAVVLSSSRGGIIGVTIEIAVLTALRLYRSGAERVHVRSLGLAIAAAVLLIAWVGADNALERFFPGHSFGDSGVSLGKRTAMVHGALGIFLDHPISGAGLGTIVAVYPRYETMYDGKLVDHVHNDYAEALAETGLLGAACGLAFFGILFRDARRAFMIDQGHFSRAVHGGAIAAVAGLAFHSFLDFNLHIFSNALLFLLQAFIATAPSVGSARAYTTRGVHGALDQCLPLDREGKTL